MLFSVSPECGGGGKFLDSFSGHGNPAHRRGEPVFAGDACRVRLKELSRLSHSACDLWVFLFSSLGEIIRQLRQALRGAAQQVGDTPATGGLDLVLDKFHQLRDLPIYRAASRFEYHLASFLCAHGDSS